MNYKDLITPIKNVKTNNYDVYMGFPGGGKTTTSSSYPKPALLITIDEDGGETVAADVVGLSNIRLTADPYDKKGCMRSYDKLVAFLDETELLKQYKTIIIDTISGVTKNLENHSKAQKGKALNFDEYSAIAKLFSDLLDKIIRIGNAHDIKFVLNTHAKMSDVEDGLMGNTTTKIIPAMTKTNGSLLLEKANAVFYSTKKVVEENDIRKVRFVTYIGAHPNMDTKIRTSNRELSSGGYFEDLTYDKLVAMNTHKAEIKTSLVIEKTANPFEDAKINAEEDF